MITTRARLYGGEDVDELFSICADDNYVYVTGETYSEFGGSQAGLLLKLNRPNLTIAAKKIYGSEASSTYFHGICEDGDYIYAVGQGYSSIIGKYCALIVKFNKSDLSIAIEKVYGLTGGDYFESVYADGDYIYAVGAAFSEGEGSYDGLLIKFNKSDLSIDARKVYGGTEADYFESVHTDTNYVYVAGYTKSEGEGDSDALIIKFNKSDLSIDARKVYGGTGRDRLESIYVDGEYVYVVGDTQSEGDATVNTLIIKFNKSDLSIDARKVYGGTDSAYFYAVSCSGDFLYIAGASGYQGEGYWNALMIKFNKSDLTINKAKIYGAEKSEVFYGGYVNGDYIYAAGYSYNEAQGLTDCLVMEFTKAVIPAGTYQSSPEAFTYQDGDTTLADSALTLADSDLTLADSALTLADSDLTLADSDLILSVLYTTEIVVAPVADFSGNPTEGDVPLTVQFTDESTNTPTSWLWDFGDGESSTEQNPEHIYTKAGTYTVTLTATNEGGSDDEVKIDYITVTSPVVAPVANFSAQPRSGKYPLQVHFTDLSE